MFFTYIAKLFKELQTSSEETTVDVMGLYEAM